ncbi:MAG: hypothetical protein J1F65_05595 [Clostridiales bacterium]|nr:hypothetical protein [Clostridiales bacterium]
MIEYDRFINEINSGIITEIYFAVKDYAHYKNCSIKRVIDTLPSGRQLVLIKVCLTADGVYDVSFLNTFKENTKLFQMGRKGTFTLKQMWNKIYIHDIKFAENK